MFDFALFIEHLKGDLRELVSQFSDEIREEFISDGIDFVTKTRGDLQTWTDQLLAGDLSEEDFLWLLESKKDLAEMEALKQKGLAKAKIDRYKNALIQTVVGSITKTFR